MINSLLELQRRIKCKVWKKWHLFHATDFQSLMYPCFTICRILGIFPYKINALTFETSKRHYIFPTVIICALCIYELEALYEINFSKNMSHVPSILARNCFYILGGFIAIVTYILSGPRMHLFQTIMEASLKLPSVSYKKMSRMIHAKDIFGFFLLVGQVSCYNSIMDFNNFDKFFVQYGLLLIHQMDMLHMNCVCVLKACFKGINDNLTNLRELVANDKPRLPRHTNNHEHGNPFLLMELKVLKKQHVVVSDTVQMLNTIFSLQVLASIVMTFCCITFYLYFYIMHWKIGKIIMNVDYSLYNTLLVTSVLYYCIKITLIAWACDTGRDQALKIGITIHEILNSTIDKQIKDELKMFSLQVLHRENTFSAKGLIIDSTLLVAIVCNVTTYLLILIQFMVADHVCNKNFSTNGTILV
ncbi:uncharacterized protein LOC113003119 [Solenopsis invicta]|uniref:uncharacterized protein LOC113003119 n=1 Tax=Solenopsis invicta TaxID=13686 RepID=UPI00193CDB94|nr:uncharacterized protein LOC113003119 [Solenopsis invicta]